MSYSSNGRGVMLITVFVLALLIHSQTVYAFGSSEKTPEEKAAENAKKATKEYNKGVERMEKGREKAMAGDSVFAYNYRATSDARAGKEYEKAIKHFKKALDYQPNLKEAYNNLGYCYRKIGKLDQSLTAYQNALKLDPDFAQAREYLGETYLAMDDPDHARAELESLIQLDSPYADTLSKSIEIYRLNEVSRMMDH